MSDLANVFRRHFRRDRNALFVWGGICGGFALLMAAMYPSIAAPFEEMIGAYPEAFLRAFLGPGLPSFATVEGFMAVEFFSWMPVMFAAFAALAGAGMVAEETDRGTVEFLLAQPVRRRTVIFGKFLVFLLFLFGIVALTAVALSVGLFAVGVDHSVRLFGHLFVLNYLVAAAYGAIALLVSTLAGELRRATSISLGVMFATWFLLMVANLSERAEPLGVPVAAALRGPDDGAGAGLALPRRRGGPGGDHGGVLRGRGPLRAQGTGGLRPPRGSKMYDLLIHNARVITVSGRGTIPRGAVALREGKIAAVGAGAELAGAPARCRVDGEGLTLAPGLVDCHSHLMEYATAGIHRVGPASQAMAGIANLFQSRCAGVVANGEHHVDHPDLAQNTATYLDVAARFPGRGAGGHCH